jgi:hypothetical protein
VTVAGSSPGRSEEYSSIFGSEVMGNTRAKRAPDQTGEGTGNYRW